MDLLSTRLSESLRFGEDFELDRRAYELRRSGNVVRLERIPMELLLLLLQHPGHLVTRQEILERIWGKGVFLDCDSSINAAVRKVRQALKDDPEHPRFIQTVTGKGYRFIAEVTENGGAKAHAAETSQPEPPTTVPVEKTAHSSRIVFVVGILLLAFVIALGAAFERSRSSIHKEVAKPVQARRSVAVLGFRNLSGRRDQDWMSTAFTEMMNTELASGEQLRVIPGQNVAEMKGDLGLPQVDGYTPETLGRIRRSLGTDVVVLGSYFESPASGGKVRLDMQVQDADRGEMIAAISETGSDAEIPELVSRAGERLRERLGIAALSPEGILQAKASLPGNPEAARFYSEGVAKLRALDPAGARTLLERAVAADPNHALSHSEFAAALALAGYDAQAQVEAKKAVDLSQNSSREEQLLIQGQYRRLSHDVPGAIESYRTLWNFFPDDLEYGLRLASAQVKAGNAKDAAATIGQLRKLPVPERDDVRIDVAEARAAEAVSDFARSEQLAAAAVSKAEAQGSRLVTAEALQEEGYAADHLGDRQKAMRLFTEARNLRAAAGDARGAASALHSIAMVQYNIGDFESSRKSYEDALRIFRQTGALWDVASCAHNLGVLLQDQGRLQESRQALEEALRIQRQIKDQRGVATDLDDLGNVLLMMGNLAQAAAMKQEALRIFQQTGNRVGEAIAQSNLAEVLLAQGDLDAAKQGYERSLELKRAAGYKKGIGYSLFGIAEVLRRQDRLADARANAEEALASRKELGNEVDVAESQMQLAEIFLQQERAAEAEPLARSAVDIFGKHKVIHKAARAEAVLSQALLAKGKVGEAAASAERASRLAKESGDVGARLQTEFAQVDVKTAEGAIPERERMLRHLREEAERHGYAGERLEAEFELGKLEIKSGKSAAGHARLARVRKEATAHGLIFLARKAAKG